MIKMALFSLYHRKLTVSLIVLSISFSIVFLLAVDRLREDTRTSFTNTLSGTHLIVGARTGSLNLLLYSIFRIGDATNNIHWKSYQYWHQHPDVDWTVPFSLGDSHRGYRVLATNNAYFSHYKYGSDQSLLFSKGDIFQGTYDVVLGSHVAKALNYQLGDKVVITHGLIDVAFNNHDKHPFHVTGILKPTGTPLDRTIHIPLAGMNAIHQKTPGIVVDSEQPITAFLVGLKSPIATFKVQRAVNEYRQEPLLAIIPGVALQQLWKFMSIAENALYIMSIMMIIVGLFSLMTVLLTGMNERRREISILRAMGARPWQLCLLLMIESVIIALLSLIIAALLMVLSVFLISSYAQSNFGIQLSLQWPSLTVIKALIGYFVMSVLVGLIPGLKAYRQSVSEGLTIRF